MQKKALTGSDTCICLSTSLLHSFNGHLFQDNFDVNCFSHFSFKAGTQTHTHRPTYQNTQTPLITLHASATARMGIVIKYAEIHKNCICHSQSNNSKLRLFTYIKNIKCAARVTTTKS